MYSTLFSRYYIDNVFLVSIGVLSGQPVPKFGPVAERALQLGPYAVEFRSTWSSYSPRQSTD